MITGRIYYRTWRHHKLLAFVAHIMSYSTTCGRTSRQCQLLLSLLLCERLIGVRNCGHHRDLTVSILNKKVSPQYSADFFDTIYWHSPATVSCLMSLENFPMDEQNHSILIGSASESLAVTLMQWLSMSASNKRFNKQLNQITSCELKAK